MTGLASRLRRGNTAKYVGNSETAPPVRAGRNGLLDAVRLIAAGLVFLGHARLATGMPGDGAMGFLGVFLFFVLSGYLIPTVWARTPDLRTYLTRRGARIVPGYLAAVVGLGILTGYPVTVRDLLMVQTFDLARFDTFMGVAWTLQLEVIFYALVPLLARVPTRWIVYLGAASLALYALAPDYGIRGTFPFRFWMFVPGMLMVGRSLPHVSVPRWVTFGATISYGIYLWHHEILRALRDMEIAPPAVWAGGALLTLTAATVSWYLVERPALASRRELVVQPVGVEVEEARRGSRGLHDAARHEGREAARA